MGNLFGNSGWRRDFNGNNKIDGREEINATSIVTVQNK